MIAKFQFCKVVNSVNSYRCYTSRGYLYRFPELSYEYYFSDRLKRKIITYRFFKRMMKWGNNEM